MIRSLGDFTELGLKSTTDPVTIDPKFQQNSPPVAVPISYHNRIRTLVTISTVGYGDQVGLRRHRFDCHAI